MTSFTPIRGGHDLPAIVALLEAPKSVFFDAPTRKVLWKLSVKKYPKNYTKTSSSYQRMSPLGREGINSCFPRIFVHIYCKPTEFLNVRQRRRSKCSLSVVFFFCCRFQKGNIVLSRKGKCLTIFFNFLARFDLEIPCEVMSASFC